MNIHLAAVPVHHLKTFSDEYLSNLSILESFYYLRGNRNYISYISKFKKFLLDSGAFTFMMRKGGLKNLDLEKFVNEYINFINKNDIKHFFELDLDNVIGLQKTEQIRAYIEKQTNKQTIPVWHVCRGLEYWKKMCDEYNYIAYGGLMSDGLTLKQAQTTFPLFLKIARSCNCKVHGLGYTSLSGLTKYKFYSVDSTSWKACERFGSIARFNGKTIETIKGKGLVKRGKDNSLSNLKEWIKFQNYAYTNL